MRLSASTATRLAEPVGKRPVGGGPSYVVGEVTDAAVIVTVLGEDAGAATRADEWIGSRLPSRRLASLDRSPEPLR